MVDVSGYIAHESCIDGALRRPKVIKSQIYTQTFSQKVYTLLNQFSSVYFN